MSKTMLTILMVVLVLSISIVGWAVDMGTAFTYQGRLSDGGAPADGGYDFEFTLYDDPCVALGNPVGSTINIDNEQVSDGLFTVGLDFGGGVFNGDARWLEIGVRPGDSGGGFTTLSPRQELTPTPYALYAQSGGGWVDDGAVVRLETSDDDVGIGTSYPTNKLHVSSLNSTTDGTDGSFIDIQNIFGSYNVLSGIRFRNGTTTGTYKGGIFYEDLASYGRGNLIFANNGTDATGNVTAADARMTITYDGNIGIGTTSPTAILHVGGTAGVDGIKFPDGTLQTTAATGGGGDDLGNHIATQNIELNGHWLSGDGGNEGVFVNNAGNVGIGTTIPSAKLHIGGTAGVDGIKFPDGTLQTTASTGDITAVNAGTGLTGGGTSGDVTLSVEVPLVLSGTASGGIISGTNSYTSGKGIYGYASNGGNVTNYGGYFVADGETGRGVYGTASNNGSVTNYGVYGEVGSKYGSGVCGQASGQYGMGVSGWASGSNGFAIYGIASGSSGKGVRGMASNTGNVTNYGVYGLAQGEKGRGVYGWASHGSTTDITYGGYFESGASNGRGVYGEASDVNGIGVLGSAKTGVRGDGSSYGVYGNGYYGVWGEGTYGVRGSGSSYGIFGQSSNYAGYFSGNVRVTGYLYKDGGGFQIDHPLDPANKYLYHSFVESPDMMNVYNGNVVLDDKGEASVAMPDYFEALNQEFRYQLTAIGTPGPNLYISEEIKTNRFKISGGKAGMKVSWQVTGIRKDPYAQANRIKVEEEKPKHARGYYLHPEVYGFGQDKSIDRLNDPKQGKLAKDQKSEVSDENS